MIDCTDAPWESFVTDQELSALALLATIEGKDGPAYRTAVAVLQSRGHYIELESIEIREVSDESSD
jgi:hypothetical protein